MKCDLADSKSHSVRRSVGQHFFRKNFLALGLDRDLAFSRGPSYGTPRDISGLSLGLNLDLDLGLGGQYFK